jgi:hypothetical protein
MGQLVLPWVALGVTPQDSLGATLNIAKRIVVTTCIFQETFEIKKIFFNMLYKNGMVYCKCI